MGLRDVLLHDITPRATLVVTIVGMIGLWAWAFGKVPVVGEDGFVLRVTLAKDVQTIVGGDINDLKRQSADTSKKVDNIKVALDAILADYYSKRVKEATRQRCKLPPTETAERDRLWDQINLDLNLYRIYSGDMQWQRPSCSEV